MNDLFEIRALNRDDRAWAAGFVADQWGDETIVVHETVYRPAALPGFVAWQAEQRIGLITFHLDGDACEIVTLDSQQQGIGVGTALLEEVWYVAQEAGCRRLWLVTTNDNMLDFG